MLGIWLPIRFKACMFTPIDWALSQISISGESIRYTPPNTAVVADFIKASKSIQTSFRCSVIRGAIRSVQSAKSSNGNTRDLVGDCDIVKHK